MNKFVNILGIRGLPAAHGGFETFAHNFSIYLIENGWEVTVYCQHNSENPDSPEDGSQDYWHGVRRVHLSVKGNGPLSTIKFDLKAALHVRTSPGIDLLLGYNTAIFTILQKLNSKKVVINMDGVEWHRKKWNALAKVWFYINEFFACHLANEVIADHPEIANHLKRHGCYRANIIPYAADAVSQKDFDFAEAMGIRQKEYYISIARIEPENSILEIVQAYSAHKHFNKLVVLGTFNNKNGYHQEILAAASEDVIFPGAIYDRDVVQSLRFNARAYIHGHQVGGTNPSLVEALGCGNPIVAHDNRFNRWVAGNGQVYFSNKKELSDIFDGLDHDNTALLEMSADAVAQHKAMFTYEAIHNAYARCLERMLPTEHKAYVR